MTRNTMVVVVVLAVAVGLFAFSSTAQRLRNDESPVEASAPARPQMKPLDWHETYGRSGERIVFEVDRFDVLRDGWRAHLRLSNETSLAWEVGDPRATLDRSFGLMLFSTGAADELSERLRQRTLPTMRPAVRYTPSLPEVLEPGRSWEGTISAPGSLAAGSYVRVVFGTLLAIGPPPEGLDETIVWITDHALRLRR